MYVKKNLMLSAAVFALALPLMLAGTAGAAVYNRDGAIHDATSGQWAAPATYCVAAPQMSPGVEWDGTGSVPSAVKRTDLTAPQCATVKAGGSGVIPAAADTAIKNAFTSGTAAADCQAAGYRWKVGDTTQPTTYVSGKNYCNGASLWTADDPTNPGKWYTLSNDACLRCHNSDYMTAANGHNPDAAKESYINSGHKNMSRPIDGIKWGMPGVTNSSLADAFLAGAEMNTDGSFAKLWFQEDYNRLPVTSWGSGGNPGTVNVAYCSTETSADNANPAAIANFFPDSAVCPNCETPIFGNGAPGYPLGYTNATTCAAAGVCTNGAFAKTGNNAMPWYNSADCTTHSGTWTASAFHWVDSTMIPALATSPLYWIYGGAGLEGGPAMMQNGSQFYKCGRCHTTGYSADSAAQTTKLPYSLFPSANLNTVNALGHNNPALLKPGGVYVDQSCVSTATCTAGTTVAGLSSWDQFGIECSRCHKATDGGHATWPSVGTAGQAGKTTGGDVVATCVTCHRQETVGTVGSKPSGTNLTGFSNPAGNIGNPASNGPVNGDQQGNPKPTKAGFCSNDATKVCTSALATAICGAGNTCNEKNMAVVWTNRWGQNDGFWHHPDGDEFLNSPHAKFKGAWSQIGIPSVSIVPSDTSSFQTGTMNTDGSTASLFTSKFAQAVVADLGENSSTAGGCTSCHDVHKPHNENIAGMGGDSAMKHICQDCHQKGAGTWVSPQVTVINHPSGAGTPLADSNPCEVCHQPAGIKHIWRINTNAAYSTFPSTQDGYLNNSAANLGGQPTNVAPDIDGNDAVWIDVDMACGQCHGGSAGSGATYNGAPYFTKAALATGAAQMHNAGYVPPTGTTPVVSHGTVTQSGYQVSFTDSSTDSGDTSNLDAVTVNWGDGATSAGVRGGIFSHTYTGRARNVSIVHIVRNSVASTLFAKEYLKLNVPVRYNVTGTVFQSDGVTAITNAYVYLKLNNHTRQVVKAAIGAFSFANVLPGTYTIHVYKSGVTFGADASVTVTATDAAQNITATNP